MSNHFTYHGVRDTDALIEFASAFRVAFYNYSFHSEKPLTPFLINSDGIMPIHPGDTIAKEYFGEDQASPFGYDFIIPTNFATAAVT